MRLFWYGVLTAYAVPGFCWFVYTLTLSVRELWTGRGYYAHPNNTGNLTWCGRRLLSLFQWISPKEPE